MWFFHDFREAAKLAPAIKRRVRGARAFTRSLSEQLLQRGIRVNGVAPGPIWTPLIPPSYPGEKTAKCSVSAPMERHEQPDEVAPSYSFLASRNASYMSGQILHPNGGTVING